MKKLFVLMLAVFVMPGLAISQDTVQKKADTGYVFTVVKELPATSVKNQFRSGT